MGVQKPRHTLIKIVQNFMVAKDDKDENVESRVIALLLSLSCRSHDVGAGGSAV